VTTYRVINICQNLRSQTAMKSVWSVSKSSIESVGSRRELVANSVHSADAWDFLRGGCSPYHPYLRPWLRLVNIGYTIRTVRSNKNSRKNSEH